MCFIIAIYLGSSSIPSTSSSFHQDKNQNKCKSLLQIKTQLVINHLLVKTGDNGFRESNLYESQAQGHKQLIDESPASFTSKYHLAVS